MTAAIEALCSVMNLAMVSCAEFIRGVRPVEAELNQLKETIVHVHQEESPLRSPGGGGIVPGDAFNTHSPLFRMHPTNDSPGGLITTDLSHNAAAIANHIIGGSGVFCSDYCAYCSRPIPIAPQGARRICDTCRLAQESLLPPLPLSAKPYTQEEVLRAVEVA